MVSGIEFQGFVDWMLQENEQTHSSLSSRSKKVKWAKKRCNLPNSKTCHFSMPFCGKNTQYFSPFSLRDCDQECFSVQGLAQLCSRIRMQNLELLARQTKLLHLQLRQVWDIHACLLGNVSSVQMLFLVGLLLPWIKTHFLTESSVAGILFPAHSCAPLGNWIK